MVTDFQLGLSSIHRLGVDFTVSYEIANNEHNFTAMCEQGGVGVVVTVERGVLERESEASILQAILNEIDHYVLSIQANL